MPKNCQWSSQGQGQDHKIWPRGQGLALRTEDYTIALQGHIIM